MRMSLVGLERFRFELAGDARQKGRGITTRAKSRVPGAVCEPRSGGRFAAVKWRVGLGAVRVG